VAFPTEPAARYATVVGPTARAADAQAGYSAFRWLARIADDLIARKVSGPETCVLEEADVMLYEREYDRLQRGLAEAHHARALPDVPSAKPALNDLLVRLRLQQSGVMSHP
jgi:hypothetical protein